ncbi:MAG: response regulator [Alphaproteobacteria bacterium]|nr:response regulator [Alphaproteobacteria bacterium]
MQAPVVPRSILVVEDDVLFRTSLQQVLGQRGYTVLGAGDASSAVDILTCEPVDLVLLDLHFPGAHGLTMLRELGRQRPELKVVVMSGKGDMDDVIAAFRGKAVDYLRKPFHPTVLFETVDRALTTREPPMDLTLRQRRPERRDSLEPQPLHGPPRNVPEVTPEPTVPEPPPDPLGIEHLFAAIASGDAHVPSLDVRAQLVRELTDRPSTSLDEVIAVISRDPGLAGALIGRANQGVTATHRRIRTLRDACVFLGNDAVAGVAAERIMDESSSGPSPFRSVLRALQENTLRTAELASTHSAAAGVDPGTAYVGALLHNVGEYALFCHACSTGAPVTAQELAVASEQHHEAIGRALAERWQLPDPYPALCGTHHAGDPEASDEERALRSLVVACWARAIAEGYTYLPGQRADEHSTLSRSLFDTLGVASTKDRR